MDLANLVARMRTGKLSVRQTCARQMSLVGVVSGCIFLAGCDTGPPLNSAPPEETTPPVELSPPVEPPTPPAPPTEAAAEPPVAPEPEMEREKAQVGVGVKGKSLEFELGTTAAKAYFQAAERVVFEIQIPQAMTLYKAEKGNAPKTHDDFMKDIIKANQIELPKLPEGSRYVYEPATEELMVEHPKANP